MGGALLDLDQATVCDKKGEDGCLKIVGLKWKKNVYTLRANECFLSRTCIHMMCSCVCMKLNGQDTVTTKRREESKKNNTAYLSVVF